MRSKQEKDRNMWSKYGLSFTYQFLLLKSISVNEKLIEDYICISLTTLHVY